jgi:hypothetical protein
MAELDAWELSVLKHFVDTELVRTKFAFGTGSEARTGLRLLAWLGSVVVGMIVLHVVP